jgi:very-short-patch-repair endonuclease
MREGTKTKLARHLRRNMTDAERHLWCHLRRRHLLGHRFRRQHPYGPYVLDFVCLESKLIIEVDGSQHLNPTADQQRDAWLAAEGFRILRYFNHDILGRTDAVLEATVGVLSGPDHSAA